jgi:hypothetical protein
MNLCILFGTEQKTEVKMLYYVSTRPYSSTRGMKSSRPPVLRGRVDCGMVFPRAEDSCPPRSIIKRGSLGGFMSCVAWTVLKGTART